MADAMQRPNVLLILNDDMGFSDLGCYGGEILTPNLDRLARGGLRFTQFYNTARCCPSRASLLTGLHPHQTGIGFMTGRHSPDGYEGNLNRQCVTLAEILKSAGYATYMSGKWHVTADCGRPNGAWPNERGFEHFYGILGGCADYFLPGMLRRNFDNVASEAGNTPGFYFTDAISDDAARNIRAHPASERQRPFFQYLAYTAPHWPLHAKSADLQKYRGRFGAGWDRLRQERLARLQGLGILDERWALSERDPAQPPWEEAPHREWQLRRMEVYAAQLDCMDQGIGRVLSALQDTGQLDNTLVIFLSDNGGCAEELTPDWAKFLWDAGTASRTCRDGTAVRVGNDPTIMPGDQSTYQSYGVPWANLSNTPFRYYKHWVHEGGIATPLIIHWPSGIHDAGGLRHQLGQLTDIVPTIMEATRAPYPETHAGERITPMEGTSLFPVFENHDNGKGMLFWEHEGNAAVREGPWKLVKNFGGARSATPGFDQPSQRGSWELYNLAEDRTELHDLASSQSERVSAMVEAYNAWTRRCGVLDWETLQRKKTKPR